VKPSRAHFFWIAVLLAVLAFAWFILQSFPRSPAPLAPAPPALDRKPEQIGVANAGRPNIVSSPTDAARTKAAEIAASRAPLGQPALEARPAVNPDLPSPLALGLEPSVKQTGKVRIRTVLSLFDFYRATFGAYPSGETNAQFVNALAGNNPKGLDILPRSSAAINALGEVVDESDIPYFIHMLDSRVIEVRGAGQDREHWTDDDVIASSGDAERLRIDLRLDEESWGSPQVVKPRSNPFMLRPEPQHYPLGRLS